jgi:hypothetical protein
MPTELADGLRLEGAFLAKIRPTNWFLRFDRFNCKGTIEMIELGYPHFANAILIFIISQASKYLPSALES